MKKSIKMLLAISIIGSEFIAASAFADVIYFVPKIHGRQYFECTVSDPTATIKLDTRDIDGEGFCSGNGHINVDGNTVNHSYFVVDNAGGRPSVSINMANGKGTITCRNLSSADSSRQEFGKGEGFCAFPSENK